MDAGSNAKARGLPFTVAACVDGSCAHLCACGALECACTRRCCCAAAHRSMDESFISCTASGRQDITAARTPFIFTLISRLRHHVIANAPARSLLFYAAHHALARGCACSSASLLSYQNALSASLCVPHQRAAACLALFATAPPVTAHRIKRAPRIFLRLRHRVLRQRPDMFAFIDITTVGNATRVAAVKRQRQTARRAFSVSHDGACHHEHKRRIAGGDRQDVRISVAAWRHQHLRRQSGRRGQDEDNRRQSGVFAVARSKTLSLHALKKTGSAGVAAGAGGRRSKDWRKMAWRSAA